MPGNSLTSPSRVSTFSSHVREDCGSICDTLVGSGVATELDDKHLASHRVHTTGTDASQLVIPVVPLRPMLMRMRSSATGSILRPKLSA